MYIKQCQFLLVQVAPSIKRATGKSGRSHHGTQINMSSGILEITVGVQIFVSSDETSLCGN